MMDLDDNNEILTVVPSDFSSLSTDSQGLFYLSSIIPDNVDSSLNTTLPEETHYVLQQVLSGDDSSQNVPLVLHVDGNTNATITPSSESNGTYTIHLSEEPLDEESSSPKATHPTYTPCLEKFIDVVTRYKCKFCNFTSGWKTGLLTHIRNSHLESAKLREMEENSMTLLNFSSADSNSTTCTSLEEASVITLPETSEEVKETCFYLCSQCQQWFTCQDACKDHMEKFHSAAVNSIKRKIKKKKPKKLSAKEEAYVAPSNTIKKMFIGERVLRCTVKGCGFRFSTNPNLQYHIKSHDDKIFTCRECKESFDLWRSLTMHLWKYHRIDLDLHTCDICGYKVHSMFKLNNHKKIHSDERSYVCETCGKCFKQLSQLKNHHIVHFDKKNSLEKHWYTEQNCEICKRKFSDSKCLKKHIQAVHSKLKPYKCPYCDHMSARKAMLQLHMRQHTGEKPFQCGTCDYKTGDHNSLRRHKMRHTGAKPYKCPHCDYACIQAISYKTHIKSRHPGKEGLYSCLQCSFKSLSKDNFDNHVNEHDLSKNKSDQETETSEDSRQLQIPETLKQLANILPNTSPVQFIYNCLDAMSQENSQDLTLSLEASTTLPLLNPKDDANSHLDDHLYLNIHQTEFTQPVCI